MMPKNDKPAKLSGPQQAYILIKQSAGTAIGIDNPPTTV